MAIMEKTNTGAADAALTLDQRLQAAIRKMDIPEITLECDENGNLIIDKDKHPDLYDWVLNG